MLEYLSGRADFRHEAMHTVFQLRFMGEQETDPAILAGECFRLVEELEAVLSRFRPDSDVQRIARLVTGESLWVAESTAACLRQSIEAHTHTDGLFDVALPEPGQPRGEIQIHPDEPLLLCVAAPCRIDLGGIGKGFALDQMALRLQALGASSALLSAGGSTHLAIGPDSWSLSDAVSKRKYTLRGAALSHSSVAEQGSHVRHPDTAQAPDYVTGHVTLQAPTAAMADAYSTAALLMDAAELNIFVRSRGLLL